MTSNERNCIKYIKLLIDSDNLAEIQLYYNELLSSDISMNWQYIYQTCYIHACLKHKTNIVEWISSLFEDLDPISKIAMRQVFSYGRYLLNRNNPYLK